GAGMIQTGYRLGMLVSGAGALTIAARAGWFVSYAVMASLLAVGILAFLLGPEPAATQDAQLSLRTGRSANGISACEVLPCDQATGELAQGGKGEESVVPRLFAPTRTTQREAAYALRRWIATAVIGPFRDFTQRPCWLAILVFVFGYKLGEAMAGVM